MRTLLIALTLAVLAPAALAQDTGPKESSERPAPPELEKQFTKARIAEKEGKFEAAIEDYERVIRGWPDDAIWVQRAFAHIVRCQILLGRFDLAERTVRHGPGNVPGLDEKWVEQALKELAAAKERHRTERLAREVADSAAWIQKMKAIWKEQGVPAEEIDRRIAKLEQDHEAAVKRMRAAEEARRRLEAAGIEEEEMRRRVEELERRRRDLDEDRWRKHHDEGMAGARREFLRLAERLGIPPEKAERFLEEHRPGRKPEEHFGSDAARRAIEEAHEVLERHRRAVEEAHANLRESREVVKGVEHRIAKLERQVDRLTRGLDDRGDPREDPEDSGRRMDRLERAVEKIADKLEPVLRKLGDRLERLESEVKRLDRK